MALLPGINLPKDIIPSGASQRGWVDCTFYGETLQDVSHKKQNYFDRYPPQGYDTHSTSPIARHPDGYYYIKVRRWSSCD
jgi:hypothetical protein